MIFRVFDIKLEGQGEKDNSKAASKTVRSAFLWSLGFLCFIYVGSEATVGGWSTTYLKGTTSLSIEIAALATSGFWLALTGGRVVGALLGSRITAQSLLKLCLATSFMGCALFCWVLAADG
jgi:fucose permease